MADHIVQVEVNGETYNVNLVSGSEYRTTITSPPQTSFNLPGGYYPIKVTAKNEAGTITAKDSTDSQFGQSLRLVVKETIAPVVTITSPTNGSFLADSKTKVIFTAVDEAGGSGINLDSLSFDLDGTKYTASSPEIAYASITNGYQFTFSPDHLDDGTRTVTASIKDNDGNSSNLAAVAFTISTLPPSLTFTFPLDQSIGAEPSITVTGQTLSSTGHATKLVLYLNGDSLGEVPVGDTGLFSKSITLIEGWNTIKGVATDLAGLETVQTIEHKLNTSIPTFHSIEITPNPVDAGTTMEIYVEVD